MVFGFFFGKKDSNDKTSTEDLSKVNKSIKKNKQTLYLVINKGSQLPIGIFSSLEKAKKYGEAATYYNCQIIEFIVDNKCKYLIDPIYEN